MEGDTTMPKPDGEMDVYAEPPVKGGQGRTDKQTEDASDIGFYVLCALLVIGIICGWVWIVLVV